MATVTAPLSGSRDSGLDTVRLQGSNAVRILLAMLATVHTRGQCSCRGGQTCSR